MKKSAVFLTMAVFVFLVVWTTATPSDADAGEYIGQICWQFISFGETDGPILVADITYMGGNQFYELTYNGILLLPEGGGAALVMGPMLLDGGGLGFNGHVNVWENPSPAISPGPASGGITHFKAVVSSTTLEGFYNGVSIKFDSFDIEHETDAGTVTLVPCGF